jgi:hypothetical protein
VRAPADGDDEQWGGSLTGLRADGRWQHGVVEDVVVARRV